MQIITTFDELDAKLEEVRLAAEQSIEARMRAVGTFRMDLQGGLPADPFSPGYREFQLDLYNRVAGKKYLIENEVSEIDVEAAVTRPFPFYTGSAAVAGEHLAGLGYVIGRLRLQPGARILEFGPGWGNTTIALASLGFDVTAVDIEKRYCDLIDRRAALNKVAVTTIVGNFFYVEETTERFDAVLFYECFHHCSDHIRLLQGLHRVLQPGGRVYLGAEPILADFPVPWGLRTDGDSLWAVRQLGWLELGFNETYFREALEYTGWSAVRHVSKDVSWATVWELEEPAIHDVVVPVSAGKLGTVIGTMEKDRIVVADAGAGYAVYGPYVSLGAGRWQAFITLEPSRENHGKGLIDVGSFAHGRVFEARAFALADTTLPAGPSQEIAIGFELAAPDSQVEVRLHCDSNADLVITGVGFRRR